MKKGLLFFVIFFIAAAMFAQDYPELTLRDINYMEDDSLLYYGGFYDKPSQPYEGDTVIVTGVVMNSPFLGADPDSGESLAAGAPSIFFQDISQPEWGGVLLRFPGMPVGNEFSFLDSGAVIKVTGVVIDYYQTTELDIIEGSFDASNIISQMERPKPVALTVADFFNEDNSPNFLAQKWEGVYVEFKNLTVVESNAMGNGTFTFMDENGLIMLSYNKGNYYRDDYTSPLPGTTIERISGYIETRQQDLFGWFGINPVYPEDIDLGTITPPSITDVIRDHSFAGYGQDVTITGNVVDQDESAAITEVKLFYSVNESDYTEMDMTLVDAQEGTYNSTIPAQNDSSIVRYYIRSADTDAAVSYSPAAAADNPYFYYVLNRDITIRDVQFVPEGSTYNSFNSYEVTVTGVVTADTSDLPGGVYYAPMVNIQDGAEKWSGIQLLGTESWLLKRGDRVSVTGIVNESYGYTVIGYVDQGVSVTVLESNVDVPEPILISTEIITNSEICEFYEGVLVKVGNINVVDENEDGDPGPGSNYGEMVISDNSRIPMNLLLDCGGHDYHNFWDPSQEGQPIRITTNDTFESITGILFYSYSLFKINPRKNEDFVGHVVVGVENEQLTPDSYSLSQNYPNPFNPSTIIEYTLPEAGDVKLRVHNVLGQEVASLVDEFKNAGIHLVNFNGAKLTSGLYFYRLDVNNVNLIRKMMLVK